MNRRLVSILLFVSASVISPAATNAATLFETASLGPIGQTGGTVIAPIYFLGVRFELTTSATTSTIGGHIGAIPEHGSDTLFAAIVSLVDGADFPDSDDLSTPDVLGTALLHLSFPSTEVSAPLEISLPAGHYALVFGSGLFGATGWGFAPFNNSVIGSPSEISWSPEWNGWRDDGFASPRFFVTGVPEPSSLLLAALGVVGLRCLKRSSENLCHPRRGV